MLVDIQKRNDGALLCVTLNYPRIDGSNQLVEALQEVIDGGLDGIQDIEISFKHVDYLNSMGITELVNLYRVITDQSRGRITFRFTNVKSKIHSILELVEFTKIVDVNPV